MIRWQRCVRLSFLALLIMTALPLSAVQADEPDEPDPDVEVVELTEEEFEALQPEDDDLQDPVYEDSEAEPEGCGSDSESSVLCAPYCQPSTRYTTVSSAERLQVIHPETLRNDTDQPITWTVTSTRNATRTYHVQGTVSAEIKAAIFASLNASINGGVQQSVSTTVNTSATTVVPPRSTRYADYAIRYYNAKVRRTQTWSNCNQQVTTYTAEAPQRYGWFVR